MTNTRKYHLKLFNLFNIANNNINSTFKLKRKLDWRLELISLMEKWNPGIISSFLKDTHIVCSQSRGYRNVWEKRWSKQSYLNLTRWYKRSPYDSGALFYWLALLTPQLTRNVLTRSSSPSFLSILAQFPKRNYGSRLIEYNCNWSWHHILHLKKKTFPIFENLLIT